MTLGIDHLILPVADLARARAFYEQALAPLGAKVLKDFPGMVGFGEEIKPVLWLRQAPDVAPVHVAFAAPDEATVDAFHAAALAAGGADNGAPGPRPQYHPGYYGAFVLDPDGHNAEAVVHLHG